MRIALLGYKARRDSVVPAADLKARRDSAFVKDVKADGACGQAGHASFFLMNRARG